MTKYISEADVVMLQKVRQICKEAPKSGRAWTLNIAGETSKQFHRAAAQLRSFLQRWFPGLWLVSIEVTSHDQVMKRFPKERDKIIRVWKSKITWIQIIQIYLTSRDDDRNMGVAVLPVNGCRCDTTNLVAPAFGGIGARALHHRATDTTECPIVHEANWIAVHGYVQAE